MFVCACSVCMYANVCVCVRERGEGESGEERCVANSITRCNYL